MARSLSEKLNRALRQVVHFVGVQRFGEARLKKIGKRAAVLMEQSG